MDNDNAREIPDELFTEDEMQEIIDSALIEQLNKQVEQASETLREGFTQLGKTISQIVEGIVELIQNADWDEIMQAYNEQEADRIATEAMNGKEVEVPED